MDIRFFVTFLLVLLIIILNVAECSRLESRLTFTNDNGNSVKFDKKLVYIESPKNRIVTFCLYCCFSVVCQTSKESENAEPWLQIETNQYLNRKKKITKYNRIGNKYKIEGKNLFLR